MQIEGNIFVISAPSGTGKSSLVKALCNLDKRIKISVSHTTRKIRGTEVKGQDYFFVSHEAFQDILNNDGFIEYAIVYDNYYGTSIEFVKNTIAAGNDIILEIDWQGAFQIKKIFPEANLIYILPPSLEVLSNRLTDRNTDSKEVIEKRLAQAREDISHADNFDFVVINDDFNTALHDIYSIIRSFRFKTAKVLPRYIF